MGGFEGGDEGGFWDVDAIADLVKNKKKKSPQRKLHIEKSDSGYSIKAHSKPSLPSNKTQVGELYDTISFIPCTCETFTLEGCDDIPLESNTIYKAYNALNDFLLDSDVEEFFNEYKVVVTKRIPLSVGLGGASSDAVAFIYLVKEVCNLILTPDELRKITKSIGVDI